MLATINQPLTLKIRYNIILSEQEFCHKNAIPYLEATAIKYLCRWRLKGGIQDLDKAIHFIEMLKEFEGAKNDDTD